MIARNVLRWLAVAMLLGALVLPLLVYVTGAATLGPYARGGPGRFLLDFYADLARFRLPAWTLFLGPVALVIVWRLLVAYAWPRNAS